ncbi:unnamed protein product [Polarella glacialis]|uniref:RRM domain-containing protein n=1 Tax=Polarella glacialis TaxID=89957 RepID=A0A813JXR3_POLGL|nr:unnamed protein product [Polarella glacialis]
MVTVAVKEVLEEEASCHLALGGFPSDWAEPELRVALLPVGVAELQVRQASHGTRVCLVWLNEGVDPEEVMKRLKSSRLYAKGLHVELGQGAPGGSRPDTSQGLAFQVSFELGQRVQLQNLRSQTELNGVAGSIVRLDEDTGGWVVELDTGEADNEILVPLENLTPLSNGSAEEQPAQVPSSSSSLVAPGADASAPVPAKQLRILFVAGLPPDWSQERCEEYFARHGELRCVRLAVRLKQGLRSALIAFRRPVNARAAFTRIQGAEVEGNLLRCELRADPVRAAGNEPPTAGGMPAAAPGQDTGAQVFAKEGHASLRPNGVSCKRKADG